MTRHAASGTDRFLDSLQDYLILQRVAREFGLAIRGYRRQEACLIIETEEGEKEVHRLRHSLDEYRFACAAAEFLRGQGFSRLPRAVWAPNGSPIVTVEGVNYTMREWVPGRQADLENVCQLTQAVEMLAWFHRCGAGFHPLEPPGVRDEWGSWPRRFAARIEEFYRFEEQARAKDDGDRFARYFLKFFEDIVTEAAAALREIENGPYARIIDREREQGGLCHRDYTGRNLILRDDGALFLSDFDDLAMDSRLEDIGKFLVRQSHWDYERSIFIIQVYHGVNRLTREDFQCLGAYLRFPFEIWNMANAYFAGKGGDRHQLKHAVEQLEVRRGLIDRLQNTDPTFLDGMSQPYNLGFANLPEQPAGKNWIRPAPVAEGLAAPDLGWWEPFLPEEMSEFAAEPAQDFEPAGTVLEETESVAVENTWAGMAGAGLEPSAQTEGENAERLAEAGMDAEANPPADRISMMAQTVENMEEGPAADHAPEVASAPSPLRWRPFPAPLAKNAGK